MDEIQTAAAPTPAGHYAQALVHGGLVYVSGQLPISPDGRDLAHATVEEQTECALANIAAILDAAGSRLDHVLKTTVYVADIALWDRVNAAYARVFGAHRPARAVVPARGLHHGYVVEIDAIAALEGKT
ncbi:MAG: RidA family protein [Anaerolineae bacterium]|nr:RidA family protein [Anaerolineae bacterium]